MKIYRPKRGYYHYENELCDEYMNYYIKALYEKGYYHEKVNKECSIFPVEYYKREKREKKYHYCYIGYSEEKSNIRNRWIHVFIQKYFDENSYVYYIDKEDEYEEKIKYKSEEYYQKIGESKFLLCGISNGVYYSKEFNEAVVCRTIPIVRDVDDTFRSYEEYQIDMRFCLCSQLNYEYKDEWVEYNYSQFLRYHTINDKPSMIPKIMENKRREEEKKKREKNRKMRREIKKLKKEIEKIKRMNIKKEKERNEYLKAMGGRDVSGIRPIPKIKKWM